MNNLITDLCNRRVSSLCHCQRKEVRGYHHAAVFFKSGTAPPLLKVHGLW